MRVRRSSLAIAFACLSLAACGSGPAVGSRAPDRAGSATPPASQAIGPDARPSGGAGSSQPTWPGTTALATIALGAADGEILKAGTDLEDAVARQDLKAMWGAADGLAKMIDGLIPNIAKLESYPTTAPAGAIYRKAFPELSAAAKQLRDAITAGDAGGVVAGARAMQQGLADYAPVRPLIDALVQQALAQQRLLVR